MNVMGPVISVNEKHETVIHFTVLFEKAADRVELDSNIGDIVRDEQSQSDRLLYSLHWCGNERSPVITLRTEKIMTSFFAADICTQYPIWIPEFGVMVTDGEDLRNYQQIEQSIRKQGLCRKTEQYRRDQEESYETACVKTRDMRAPIWLGTGYDIRLFIFSSCDDFVHSSPVEIRGNAHVYGGRSLNWIQPLFHNMDVHLPENKDKNVYYGFGIGRGTGCQSVRERTLEAGCLPIVHHRMDDGILYKMIAFAAFESADLCEESVIGTPFLVVDKNSRASELTGPQNEIIDELMQKEFELFDDDEMVFYLRIEISNPMPTPQYAYFLNIVPCTEPYALDEKVPEFEYEKATGFSLYKQSNRVFAVSKMDGKPLADTEISFMIKPGESRSLNLFVPHRPISRDRAHRLFAREFDVVYNQCKRYWFDKLASAARIKIPDHVIQDKLNAGLLHLLISSFGQNPEGPVSPAVGQYPAIGSESAPIVEFYDSMGWSRLAQRCAEYFLEKQFPDGEIRVVEGYHIETAGALHILANRYAYSHDGQWASKIAPAVRNAADFLLRWIERNKKEALRGQGYGMIDGRVADPLQQYHSFMLNGFAYRGLSGAAKLMQCSNAAYADYLARQAKELRQNIRESFLESMGRSPAVPLSDGSWCPGAPPWPEYSGPVSLHALGGHFQTHAAMQAHDSLLGPLWLIFTGVYEPDELPSEFLMRCHSELMLQQNVAFSQPYYSRHPWIHLVRGEPEAFLKAYFNAVSGLSDRSIHTFWEHFSLCTAHKTHEEGWFLMETRWMLYLEWKEELRLLSGVPRSWLEDGKTIELDEAVCRYGRFSFKIQSSADSGFIRIQWRWLSGECPEKLIVRLPHPRKLQPEQVHGAQYDAHNESMVFLGKRENLDVTVCYINDTE